MAEILGATASAISLFTLLEQIVQSIDRLKAVRSFMKNAATEFQEFIDDIELVQIILVRLRPEMLEAINLPSMERRLRAFQRDLDALAYKMHKFKNQTTNGRLAIMKLALKKDIFQVQKQHLDSIKTTMMLLQQTYCSTSIRELKQKVDSSIISRSPIARPERCQSFEQWPRIPSEKHNQESKRHKINRGRFRFRTPLVFFDKLWTFDIFQSFSTWNFTIQVNNVLPLNSEIFRLCRQGRVEEIQKLFTNRLASPFDCNCYGEGLLHLASQFGQLAVCQMLLENGADPGQRNKWGATPLGKVNAAARAWIEHPEKVPLFLELYRLFVREFGDELFEDLDNRWPSTSGFQGPPEAFSLIQEVSFNSYSDLPVDFRFKQAMTIDNWWVSGASPTILRMAMGGDHIDHSAYFLEDENGETLLYRIAQGMAVDFSERKNSNMPKWRELLSGAITAYADPCHLSSKYKRTSTPLTTFLRYSTKNWAEIKRAKYIFDSTIQFWVSELQLAGVDLAEYGAKEKSLHMSGVIDLELSIYVGLENSGPAYDPDLGEYLLFRILSLEFGPRPEEWKLWVSNPVDELAWEFWELVERGEQVMPGTWID